MSSVIKATSPPPSSSGVSSASDPSVTSVPCGNVRTDRKSWAVAVRGPTSDPPVFINRIPIPNPAYIDLFIKMYPSNDFCLLSRNVDDAVPAPNKDLFVTYLKRILHVCKTSSGSGKFDISFCDDFDSLGNLKQDDEYYHDIIASTLHEADGLMTTLNKYIYATSSLLADMYAHVRRHLISLKQDFMTYETSNVGLKQDLTKFGNYLTNAVPVDDVLIKKLTFILKKLMLDIATDDWCASCTFYIVLLDDMVFNKAYDARVRAKSNHRKLPPAEGIKLINQFMNYLRIVSVHSPPPLSLSTNSATFLHLGYASRKLHNHFERYAQRKPKSRNGNDVYSTREHNLSRMLSDIKSEASYLASLGVKVISVSRSDIEKGHIVRMPLSQHESIDLLGICSTFRMTALHEVPGLPFIMIRASIYVGGSLIDNTKTAVYMRNVLSNVITPTLPTRKFFFRPSRGSQTWTVMGSLIGDQETGITTKNADRLRSMFASGDNQQAIRLHLLKELAYDNYTGKAKIHLTMTYITFVVVSALEHEYDIPNECITNFEPITVPVDNLDAKFTFNWADDCEDDWESDILTNGIGTLEQ